MKLSKKILFYVKFGSVFYFSMGPVAHGNPIGADVVAGGATFADLGGQFNITTATDKTVINWNSFSIGNGEITNFIQPNAHSATLNRVIGDMPSDIAGQLVSNGRVGLINPNGILITREGSINTNGFFASTLNLSDSDFLGTGKLTFKGESESIVSNSGNILARQGDVFLIGRNVQNSGTIETRDGNVALAAGSEVTLMKAGDGRLSVRIPVDSKKGSVSHSGAIKAVQQTLKDNDGNPYILGMNVDSGAEMTPEDFMNAQVEIQAGTGRAEVSGSITAGSQTAGGEVSVSGNEVIVSSGASINASGDYSAGTIKIGGGYQGNDASISNAQTTWVQAGANITADSRLNGDGGTVIVWADQKTAYSGSISAQAGTLGGNGGFVEVSGKQWLGFAGTVNTTALNGLAGTLLLDPMDINVVAGGLDDLIGTAGNDGNPDQLGFGEDIGMTSNIDPAFIVNLMKLNTVTLQATNNITITNAIDASTNAENGLGLILQAGNSIITALGAGITTRSGIITLSANDPGGPASGSGGIFINAPLSTAGGGGTDAGVSLTVNGGTGGINLGASITSSGAGNISITSGSGGVLQSGAATINAGSGTILVDGNDGSISLP
jgi:filamentous hemagglutinin family protein